MKSKMVRSYGGSALALCLLGACGGPPQIHLEVSGVLRGTQRLLAIVEHNEDNDRSYEFTELRNISIRLPESLTGKIEITLAGLDSRRCAKRGGYVSFLVRGQDIVSALSLIDLDKEICF